MGIRNWRIYDKVIEESCRRAAKKTAESVIKKCKDDRVCVIPAPSYAPTI